MDKIRESVDQLIRSIEETDAYKDYHYYEKLLLSDEELKKQIDYYRVCAYHMVQDHHDDLYEVSDSFEKDFETLRKNPVVNGYLEAEIALCRLLQRITVRIDSEVGLHIPEV